MPNTPKKSPILIAIANLKIHHANLADIKKFTPEKLAHLQRGGIRFGPNRTSFDAQQMLDKIPPSHRAGVDGQSAALRAKGYLNDKDASHIISHNQGGSSHPDNMMWEGKSANRSRGERNMTPQEKTQLKYNSQIDNLKGAFEAGLSAVPKGVVIGATTTIPFAMLRNYFRVTRGEIPVEEAVVETMKDTAIGGGIGGLSAFTITTVATAFPPFAVTLTAVSPALLVVGGASMFYEFFNILETHKKQVQDYYEALSEQDTKYFKELEEEIAYQHQKDLDFLASSRQITDLIVDKKAQPGIEGALQQYLESVAIAESLGLKTNLENEIDTFQSLLPDVE